VGKVEQCWGGLGGGVGFPPSLLLPRLPRHPRKAWLHRGRGLAWRPVENGWPVSVTLFVILEDGQCRA
jgi:hypothetical protein